MGIEDDLKNAGFDDMDALERDIEKELKGRKRENEDDGAAILEGTDKARMGVLLRLLTAVQDSNEYRQAILTASLKNDEEADRLAAAITEAKRYDLSLDPILDWMASRCAVDVHGHGESRAQLGIKGLTHSTFTSMRYQDKKFKRTGLKYAQERMKQQRLDGMTWQQVADDWELSKATAWRIGMKGHEPMDNKIRAKLGMSEIIIQYVYRDRKGRFSKGDSDETE